MKKIISFLLLILSVFSLSSCLQDIPDDTTVIPSTTQAPKSKGFYFHYYRPDERYSSYNMWIWTAGRDGKDYSFNGVDSNGAFMKCDWTSWSEALVDGSVSFIVKEAKVWADNPEKDVESDRTAYFNEFELGTDLYYHIYLMSGDPEIYKINPNTIDRINSFKLYADNKDNLCLGFSTNNPYKSFKIMNDTKTVINSDSLNNSNVIKKDEKSFQYKVDTNAMDIFNLSLEVTFDENKEPLTKTAEISEVYNTKAFNDLYYYDGELGAIYTKNETTFKVWSPSASKIELVLYFDGTPKSLGGSDECATYSMNKGEKGVWSCTVKDDLEGIYYTYSVTNSRYKNIEVVDPYAKSTGVNGLRGMIVDFSKTNPDGWENVNINDIPSQSRTVYESHIADLTSSTTWGGTNENAKKFTGFYEAGTTYTEGNVTVKTGFDHIKELGVNTVQLLPIFDQANDETVERFNWGYNPLNYNSLDGIYSSNPKDGYAKIKEFKNLVKAYNEAGIDIIMDVVYNHVNSLTKSNFDVLMPGYYFRYSNGSATNGSGCGNETASEMPMFRKFMIDSTEFWATEYKLAGFRFDLMGLHDIDTMSAISSNLKTKISSNFTVYGEPWTGGSTPLAGNLAAKKDNFSNFDGFGCFNDSIRDALIKGGMSSNLEKGWVTSVNNSIYSSDIALGITGKLFTGGEFAPEKLVNYVTCHDNYTLYDRIKAAGIKDEDTIKKMSVLANSVVFTSQGITFMLSGEEFLRTKGGNNNSYNSSYKVNELDYSLKIKNLDVFNNYKKLIALKQNANLFAKNSEECAQIQVIVNESKTMIYFDLVDKVQNRTYRIALSNGVEGNKKVDFEGYTLYQDTLNLTDLVLDSNTELQAYQTIIAYKDLV